MRTLTTATQTTVEALKNEGYVSFSSEHSDPTCSEHARRHLSRRMTTTVRNTKRMCSAAATGSVHDASFSRLLSIGVFRKRTPVAA
jgi:hypothetical protein